MMHLIGLLISLCLAAHTQSPTTSKPEQTGRARTEINFENQVVNGKTDTSLGSIVEGVGSPTPNTIIDLREDFVDKLIEDTGGNLP